MPSHWRGGKARRKEQVVVKRRRFLSKLQAQELRDNLRTLGFNSYAQYLNSTLWKSIRQKVIDRDGGTCRGCGSDSFSVHHSQYSLATLKGELLVHLHSTCGRCHREFHKNHRAESPNDPKTHKRLNHKAALRKRQCAKCGNRKQHLNKDRLCRYCAAGMTKVEYLAAAKAAAVAKEARWKEINTVRRQPAPT